MAGAISRSAGSGEPSVTSAADPVYTPADPTITNLPAGIVPALESFAASAAARQSLAYSRYPKSVLPAGTYIPPATQEQKIAAGADYTGVTAVPRENYIAEQIASSTGVDYDTALQQVQDYRARTGYYPAIGVNTQIPGADKIYGPGASAPLQQRQSASEGLTSLGLLGGNISIWLITGLALGAVALLMGWHKKGGKRG